MTFDELREKITDCRTLHDLDQLKNEVKANFDKESDERTELLGIAGVVEDRLIFG